MAITATNSDLEQRVRSGQFRADLYYRVSVATHTLPSLREVKEDIPLLADHFRELFNREFRKETVSISPAVLEMLQRWDWPGNVQELRNAIERAMIFADGAALEPSDLPELGGLEVTTGAPEAGDAFKITRGVTLAQAEKEYIRCTLADCSGSVQRAAESLGISRKSLWERRKKYKLSD